MGNQAQTELIQWTTVNCDLGDEDFSSPLMSLPEEPPPLPDDPTIFCFVKAACAADVKPKCKSTTGWVTFLDGDTVVH